MNIKKGDITSLEATARRGFVVEHQEDPTAIRRGLD